MEFIGEVKFYLTLGLPRSESMEIVTRWGLNWPRKKGQYFLEILTNFDEFLDLEISADFKIFIFLTYAS